MLFLHEIRITHIYNKFISHQYMLFLRLIFDPHTLYCEVFLLQINIYIYIDNLITTYYFFTQ